MEDTMKSRVEESVKTAALANVAKDTVKEKAPDAFDAAFNSM